jgi:glycyl-tRNA synthetase
MATAERARVVTMDKIAALCKRRGFIFPGSDIYGGLANTWDYGPLGVELKRNVKDLWWRRFVHQRRDIVGLDAGILMHPRVWEASGHVESFNDPLVDCRTCRSRFRADHLIEERLHRHVEGKSPAEMSAIIREAKLTCPVCGNATLTDARQFNMMFRTTIGPLEETGTEVFLRPETAQAMFVQYKNIVATGRVKVPFGIAQIGKAFRNEITPGNFIFRLLEFEQMEIEYFVKPDAAAESFETWLADMRAWLQYIGIRDRHLRVREHDPDELSHYSSRTVDFEYDYPGAMGWRELYGLANRTDFDLTQHQTVSGEDLQYFDQAENRRYLPYVIEPTFGVDRTCLTVLVDAYDEEELSHYSSRTIDFEYDFPTPMGWKELYGLANRTDFDLTQHQQYSGEDLTYFDQEAGTRYLPHVIEPTFGVDRTLLVILLDAYDEEATVDVNGKPEIRTVLRLNPKVAPYKAAVLPLMKKPELAEVARGLYEALERETSYLVDYDETGNIGKRYRRQDEAGTPFCFTIDYDTLEDRSVTVRDRDSMSQTRLGLDEVPAFLREKVG